MRSPLHKSGKLIRRTSEPRGDRAESLLLLEGLLGDEPLPEEEDATALQLRSLYTGRTQTSLKMEVKDTHMFVAHVRSKRLWCAHSTEI